MDYGLVVIEDTDADRDLLREAAENASGTGAKLLLLMLLDESEYEHDLETLESIGDVENVSYGEESILEGAKQEANEIASETIDEDFDIEWDVLVDVIEEDQRARAVVQASADNGCDHAFILGRQRSPTGKAIFGDFAQRVILNFDGYVTVATE